MTGPSSAAELSARLLAAGDTRDFTTVNDFARSTGCCTPRWSPTPAKG
jgi:hypothetical protein